MGSAGSKEGKWVVGGKGSIHEAGRESRSLTPSYTPVTLERSPRPGWGQLDNTSGVFSNHNYDYRVFFFLFAIRN